jgi:predicted phage tail protein
LFAGAAEPTETPSIAIAPARKSESENILILVSPGFAFAIVGVKQMLARRIGTRQRTENPPQRFL